jgi:hypothetical protein
VRSVPSRARRSKAIRDTGIARAASATPCVRLRRIRSWKGKSPPVTGWRATASASKIAVAAFRCARVRSTASGYWAVIIPPRREKIRTSAPRLWICNLSPSYLYSAAQRPPSLVRISAGSFSRSASIGRMG